MFVVISGQRSGSTFLIEQLCENDYSAYEELFLFELKKWPSNAGKSDVYTYEYYKARCRSLNNRISEARIISGYLDLLVKKAKLRNEKLVFKLMYGQLIYRPLLIIVLLSRRAKFIHLIRKNYRDTYLSQIAKNIVGYSHNINGKNKLLMYDARHKLKVQKYIYKFLKRKALVVCLNLFIKNRLYYEEIINNSGFSFGSESIELRSLRLKKMSLDYSLIFENYESFCNMTERFKIL